MITFQEESYIVMFTPEFWEMAKKHYREVGGFKDSNKIKLSVNWGMYKLLGKQNRIAMFTAKEDTKLIGYNFYIIANHPHYQNAIIAEADSVYVIPKFRKGFIGYKLIKYSVKCLLDRVDAITLNMHIEHKFDSIAKRLGFKPLECKYILET